MSLDHCAQVLASGDPERFMVLRGCDAAAQARLVPLYALNLEIGRAAWASEQPMVAEMRLQWWVDALEELGQGEAPRAHPVLAACDFLRGDAVACGLAQMIAEARRNDVWREPFADAAALMTHLDLGGGSLMWLAARSLGAVEQEPVRAWGQAAALAAWLRGVPDMVARGMQPLPDPAPAAITALARDGLALVTRARAGRGRIAPAARPALLTGWQSPALLALAAAEPGRVGRGTLALSEFSARGRLAWAAATGRW